MPKPADCPHPAVVITVHYDVVVDLHSFDFAAATPAMPRLGAPRMYTGGYPAVLHARCKDCGLLDVYSTEQYPMWPAWLHKHWGNLVAAGGIARQLTDHYGLHEEAPCPA